MIQTRVEFCTSLVWIEVWLWWSCCEWRRWSWWCDQWWWSWWCVQWGCSLCHLHILDSTEALVQRKIVADCVLTVGVVITRSVIMYQIIWSSVIIWFTTFVTDNNGWKSKRRQVLRNLGELTFQVAALRRKNAKFAWDKKTMLSNFQSM